MFQPSTDSPSVTVPKFAVAEDCNSPLNNHEVRFAEDWVLLAIPNANSPQGLPQPILDFGAGRPDS